HFAGHLQLRLQRTERVQVHAPTSDVHLQRGVAVTRFGSWLLEAQREIDVAARQVAAQPLPDQVLEALGLPGETQVGAEVTVVDGANFGTESTDGRVQLRLAIARHAPDHRRLHPSRGKLQEG